ncbi:hypothetical protein EDB87DRAFT_1580495 [Lactarius vividus]|nr:hypothetical protein EDB87DRAFT_1580495 [Lactarius vividus]
MDGNLGDGATDLVRPMHVRTSDLLNKEHRDHCGVLGTPSTTTGSHARSAGRLGGTRKQAGTLPVSRKGSGPDTLWRGDKLRTADWDPRAQYAQSVGVSEFAEDAVRPGKHHNAFSKPWGDPSLPPGHDGGWEGKDIQMGILGGGAGMARWPILLRRTRKNGGANGRTNGVTKRTSRQRVRNSRTARGYSVLWWEGLVSALPTRSVGMYGTLTAVQTATQQSYCISAILCVVMSQESRPVAATTTTTTYNAGWHTAAGPIDQWHLTRPWKCGNPFCYAEWSRASLSLPSLSGARREVLGGKMLGGSANLFKVVVLLSWGSSR